MTPVIVFSILIPTVPSRLPFFFPALIESLEPQTRGKPVEIIGLFDNKTRTVGEKRNTLLQMARGEFLAFIDDDDRIADTYVDKILQAIAAAPQADCIVFDQEVRINGGRPKRCKYGTELEYTETPDLWTGKPAHTMCWRAELAKRHAFPSENYGEDIAWVKLAAAEITQQHRIDEVLYFYDFNRRTSETRK